MLRSADLGAIADDAGAKVLVVSGQDVVHAAPIVAVVQPFEDPSGKKRSAISLCSALRPTSMRCSR